MRALPLRTPRVEMPLEALEQERHRQPRGRDDHQVREYLAALKGLPGDHHRLPDAVLRGDVLADDDTDERVTEAQPQAGEDERHRSRQRDGPEDLEVAAAERSRDADELRVEVAHARGRVDEHREERPEEDDRDLRLDAD